MTKVDKFFIPVVIFTLIACGWVVATHEKIQAPAAQPTYTIQSFIARENARSSRWETFERKCVALHPFCAACGKTNDELHREGSHLEAHHIRGFQFMTEAQRGTDLPGGELDPQNIIILCRKHHLEFGHLGNFRGPDNDHVVEDAQKHLNGVTTGEHACP